MQAMTSLDGDRKTIPTILLPAIYRGTAAAAAVDTFYKVSGWAVCLQD